MALPLLPMLGIGLGVYYLALIGSGNKPYGKKTYGKSSPTGYPSNYREVLSLPEGVTPEAYMEQAEAWVDSGSGAVFVEVGPDAPLNQVRALMLDAAKQYPSKRFATVASAIVDPLHESPANSFTYMPPGELPPVTFGYLNELEGFLDMLGFYTDRLKKNVPNFKDYRGSVYGQELLNDIAASTTTFPMSVVLSVGPNLSVDQARNVLRQAAAFNPTINFNLLPGDLAAQLRGEEPSAASIVYASRLTESGTVQDVFSASTMENFLGAEIYDALVAFAQ